MAETSQECSEFAVSNSSIFSILRRNKVASWAERQSNDREFQTEVALTLKAFAETLS